MNEQPVIQRAFAALDRAPVRVWSLIATIYGDCAMPRGGELWLGSLTEILGALGVEPGSVRAAMSRLARQGFLERTRVGRTSHYRLSAAAIQLSRQAEALIYRSSPPDPPAGWDIAFTHKADRAAKARLGERGYLMLGANVYARAHMSHDRGVLPAGVLHLQAQGDDCALAHQLYDVPALAARYRAFLAAADVISARTADARGLDAVAQRVTLVHGFRRAVLRDPQLPARAQPPEWPVADAYQRFARLYKTLEDESERWLAEHAQNASGMLPAVQADRRFCAVPEGQYVTE